jgi:hypothetical protein
LTITQVLADINLRPGPGPGPKKKFDRDRDQPEISTGTGTGTKNFLLGLDRDRDQKKVILQIPTLASIKCIHGSFPKTNRVVGDRKSSFLIAPSKAIRLIDDPNARATVDQN